MCAQFATVAGERARVRKKRKLSDQVSVSISAHYAAQKSTLLLLLHCFSLLYVHIHSGVHVNERIVRAKACCGATGNTSRNEGKQHQRSNTKIGTEIEITKKSNLQQRITHVEEGVLGGGRKHYNHGCNCCAGSV